MSENMLHEATRLGTERGMAAASWVFDGNTTDETYRRFLALSEAGDPALHDEFGPATGWLSGEFAGGPTPHELAHELGIEPEDHEDWTETEYAELDEACDAYETAADEAYWAELERVARAQLED